MQSHDNGKYITVFCFGGAHKDTCIKGAYRDSMYKHISQVTGQVITKDQVFLKKEIPVCVGSEISDLMLKSKREDKHPDRRSSKV